MISASSQTHNACHCHRCAACCGPAFRRPFSQGRLPESKRPRQSSCGRSRCGERGPKEMEAHRLHGAVERSVPPISLHAQRCTRPFDATSTSACVPPFALGSRRKHRLSNHRCLGTSPPIPKTGRHPVQGTSAPRSIEVCPFQGKLIRVRGGPCLCLCPWQWQWLCLCLCPLLPRQPLPSLSSALDILISVP